MDKQKQNLKLQNIRKEDMQRQDMLKLNVEAGWRKVIMNINIKQGQYKGRQKDVNRMR